MGEEKNDVNMNSARIALAISSWKALDNLCASRHQRWVSFKAGVLGEHVKQGMRQFWTLT